MKEYILKNGKKLRLGYTTGTCAAAAAKAAAAMLLTGKRKERISAVLPGGDTVDLEILDIQMEDGRVSCAVEKDSGDDPDITKGVHVTAAVSKTNDGKISVDGGAGVGRVTKPGLDQPVGAAAINSVPRKMIEESLREVCSTLDYKEGLLCVISVPGGEELAKKTFNPRLGITGGISILGTTGIVEPMSEQALVDTIRVEVNQKRAEGHEYVLLTPGNYGAEYIRTSLGIDPETAVQTSNFIGDSLDICGELGFKGALIVGHIGKLVKIAGGMLNTHSKYGDCRMEIMAAHSAACGLSAERTQEMLSCATCDDAIRILKEDGLYPEVMERLTEKIYQNLEMRAGNLETGVIIFSRQHGLLGSLDRRGLLEKITDDNSGRKG